MVVHVHGRSMEPTLIDGDRLICSRREPRRIGAIVVRDTGEATSARRFQIKRLVAIEGAQRAGKVVPRAQCWIEGDNKSESGDSRVFGPVPRQQLVSVAIALLRTGRLRDFDDRDQTA